MSSSDARLARQLAREDRVAVRHRSADFSLGVLVGGLHEDADAELARQLAAEEESLRGDYHSEVASSAADMQMAMMLQQMELATSSGNAEVTDDEGFVDPVWGKLELAEGQKMPSPVQVLCFSLCPCCVGSFSSDTKRAALWTALRTCSFALAALQLLLLLLAIYRSGGLAPRSMNPMLGPTADALDTLGARNTARLVYQGQLWRLISPSLLHAGFVHLMMNVMMQLRIGLFLELHWGAPRWLVVYFSSGAGSALLSSFFLPDQLGVGASGSLMGLLGAYSVEMCCHWEDGDANDKSQRQFQLVMVFVNCLVVLGFSLVPMIDWAAHLGGMVVGALVACVLFGPDCEPVERGQKIRRRGAWALGAYVLACGSAIVLLVRPNEALLEICVQVQRELPKHICA